MDQDALRAQLDRLRQKFKAELPAKLAEADALLAALQADDGQALAALRMIAHRLHGTGGTMGFTALSDAAAALEMQLDACLKAGGAGPQDVAAIAAGLAAVKAAG
ncbi:MULTISPECIES: Hpt domain-containing protein [Inquilinus]|uniref:HPt (Histidine-containing phosphotransfer) domain-containing protein n=1 Tax=Inquilinus ginsengisoli TaxID=363840 RepID=A0ABU1K1T7_9PROT|nr:Hpt domain-containing protein [Inquilinus ginsengisoli]MDR6293749.1 HPt (histidine-containing phosphotransfer) domain-containing protein [Inquilinus ginsengisoli]